MPRPNNFFHWFVIRVCQVIVICGVGLLLGILIAYLTEV